MQKKEKSKNHNKIKYGKVSSMNSISNRVEIIGVPGSGKSTIFKAACRLWNHKAAWVYFNKLLQPKKPVILSPRSWLKYILNDQSIVFNQNMQEQAGIRFLQQNSDFVDFCWKYINDNVGNARGGFDLRTRAIYYLFKDFCRLQLIHELADVRLCLIDEGILQKSFLVEGKHDISNDDLSKYINLAPLPRAVFIVEISNPDEIIVRLRGREKNLSIFQGKDDGELKASIRKYQEFFIRLSDILSSKGIEVYKIESDISVEANAKVIIKELSHMMNV